MELDSGLRSVDIIAGVYGRTVYDIEDVLCGRCEPAKAIVPSPLYAGLSVISAPYEGGEVAAVPLGRLLQAVRPYFDFILLDTAAGMGAPFTAAATVADRALLVLTPDPVALRDGKIVADRLLAGGRPQSAVRLVMNRVTRDSFGKRASVEDLDECIDTVGAQLIAVIPESVALQQAGAAGTVAPCARCRAGRAGFGKTLMRAKGPARLFKGAYLYELPQKDGGSLMTIALVAHDSKKELMVQFCTAYRHILAQHHLIATGTTGRLVEENVGLPVQKFLPGGHGGGQQVMALIACEEVDMLLFFRDPIAAKPSEPNEMNLLRICDVHNIPVATNIATAEVLIHGLEHGDLDWRTILHPSHA